MSSAISTEKVRLKPDAASDLQPWQFFVLVALACATAVTFLVRGQSLIPIVLLTVLMGATVFVGLAALRTIRPLVTNDVDRTVMIGERTRAALEREKMLTLRAIKDLDFDRAMGKISDKDFVELTVGLRARASRLIRQLDAGGGYRDQIERELAKRVGTPSAAKAEAVALRCTTCKTLNESDARFCKGCGAKL